MKELKDYLHFYLGCKMTRKGFTGDLIKVKENGDFKVSCSGWWENTKDVEPYKPILRPLSSMTKEQYEEWDAIGTIILGTSEWIEKEAEKTKYLLSKHFDLFGLIEAGLAIDQTKLIR